MVRFDADERINDRANRYIAAYDRYLLKRLEKDSGSIALLLALDAE